MASPARATLCSGMEVRRAMSRAQQPASRRSVCSRRSSTKLWRRDCDEEEGARSSEEDEAEAAAPGAHEPEPEEENEGDRAREDGERIQPLLPPAPVWPSSSICTRKLLRRECPPPRAASSARSAAGRELSPPPPSMGVTVMPLMPLSAAVGVEGALPAAAAAEERRLPLGARGVAGTE